MAETSLRAYIHQLEGLLSQQAFDEVIKHCRHILDRFPKHLDTYRVLGKALLEEGRHQDASDIFLRVLSADPSDFTAHVGLSIIYEETDALDQTIWHMERAFEFTPNNEAIQDELRRLYGKRDGYEPSKIQLTRGALARLYARGGLFDQALAELTQALTDYPDRVDLLALLAGLLWDNHHTLKAGEVAVRVLKHLPHCLLANRILGEMWLKKGDAEEAAAFLSRVEALDPYLALEIRSDGQKVTGDEIDIPRLAWTTTSIASTVESESPDWVGQLGAALDEAESSPPSAPEQRSITDIFMEPSPSAPAPEVSVEADAPDWLANMETVAEPPDTVAEIVAEPEAEAQEAPDWLGDIVGDIPKTGELPSDVVLPDAGVDVDAVPDWLMDIAGESSEAEAEAEATPELDADEDEDEEAAPAAVATPATEDPDAPDWLSEINIGTPMTAPDVEEEPEPELASKLEPEPEPEPEPQTPLELEAWDPASVEVGWKSEDEESEEEAPEPEAEALPDWLEEVEEAEAPTPPAEAPQPEEPTAEEVPDWLQSEDVSEKAPDQPQASEPEAEALPDWLQAEQPPIEESSPADEGDEEPKEALPDWLTAETETPEEESQVAPSTIAPGDEETPEEEQPDWMKEGDFDGDEAMAWLESLAAKQGADPAEFVAPAAETPAEEPMPSPVAPSPSLAADDDLSWLREPTEAKPEPTAEAEAEVPDWLAEQAPEAEAPVAAEPEKEAEPVAAATPADELPDWLTADKEPEEEAAPPAPEPDAVAATEAEPAAEAMPADELPDWLTVDDEPEEEVAPPAPEPDAAKEAEPVAAATPADELPDWLTADEEPEEEEAAPAAEEPAPTPAPVPEPVAAAEEEEPEFIESGEFDGDEAMAWLEGLAARQGADPDELITEQLQDDAATPPPPAPPAAEDVPAAEPAEPAELPDWLTAEAPAETEIEEAPPVAEPVAAAEPEAEAAELDWMSQTVEPEAATEDDALADFLEQAAAPPAPPAAPEPEPEPTPAAEAELPAWLTAADEEPEEDTALADFLGGAEPTPPAIPELPPEPVAPPPPPPPPVAPPPPPLAAAPPPAAPAPVSGDVATRLAFARENLESNRVAALDTYQELVSAGEGLENVIQDLLEVVEGSEGAVDPRARRLLGDALMAEGRVQEAVDAYRGALDQI